MGRKRREQLILTPENIQEENAKYEKLKRVDFKSGGFTEIHTFFKPQRIQEFIQDLFDFLTKYQKNGKSVDDNDFHLFFSMHLIKHFSTICQEFPKDIYEKVSFIRNLSEHPCLFELKDMFDDKEVAKVWEAIFKQVENQTKLMKLDKELRQKFMNKLDSLEHRETIKSVFGLKVSDVNGEEIQKPE